MPSRKQRKKRQKELRHEYEFVVVDEDGREVEVDPDELKAQRVEKQSSKAVGAGSANGRAKGSARDARGRPIREVKPPSWQRTWRRAGAFTAVMFLALSFLAHGGSLAGRLLLTLGYGVLFVPFLYLMDRWQYSQYLRRAGQAPAAKREPARTAKPASSDKPSRRGLRRGSRA